MGYNGIRPVNRLGNSNESPKISTTFSTIYKIAQKYTLSFFPQEFQCLSTIIRLKVKYGTALKTDQSHIHFQLLQIVRY